MAKPRKYSPAVRERAVRLVLDSEGEHGSRWAAVESVAGKIGCAPQTLLKWIVDTERDAGKRPGSADAYSSTDP